MQLLSQSHGVGWTLDFHSCKHLCIGSKSVNMAMENYHVSGANTWAGAHHRASIMLRVHNSLSPPLQSDGGREVSTLATR